MQLGRCFHVKWIRETKLLLSKYRAFGRTGMAYKRFGNQNIGLTTVNAFEVIEYKSRGEQFWSKSYSF